MTRRVGRKGHRGLQNENSFIFTLYPGVVINLALLIGRAWEGRSDRHRNTIPRQVIILLRAPNLWPGILWYPLNHPSFHFIRTTFFCFPLLQLSALLQIFKLKNEISIALSMKTTLEITINSSTMVHHVRAIDINCGDDRMLTFLYRTN